MAMKSLVVRPCPAPLLVVEAKDKPAPTGFQCQPTNRSSVAFSDVVVTCCSASFSSPSSSPTSVRAELVEAFLYPQWFGKKPLVTRMSKGPSYVEKTSKELSDYCMTLEGEDCCSCWEASLELGFLQSELPESSVKNLSSEASGSTPAVYSSPSNEENLAHSQEIEVVETDVEIGISSHIILPAVAMSGPIVEENVTAGEIALSDSVVVSETEHPLISKPTDELWASKGVEGKLKQRKILQNKQVLGERLDAWEEAYEIESEQHKMDELFMKEALLEAKKAGDTWEVPVGAVLVQHGIIIARGHNLVEELRDSTAHAEMICIREASNQLRSWRLLDTTLYVTLEPCPMCAGAILQARITTLVWGAPNKLLGADGSWIRLFNGGNESETTDKPTAPLHPFHPNMTIRRGILGSECADVMQQFFQLRRRKREENVKKK